MQLISPLELNNKISNGEDYVVLDIREQYEHIICEIGGIHIPMGELEFRMNEVSKESKVVVMCKTGKRAEAVANLLATEYNYSKILVLEGGIIGWIEQVAPNLELY